MRAILLLLISLHSAVAGMSRYSNLIVADPPNQSTYRGCVRVTYLGTNGYQLEAHGHSILIDPYFSRISLARVALGWQVRPDPLRIEEAMAHLKSDCDAILVTHAHFDHLSDVPVVMKKTGARLIGSETAVDLAQRAGAARAKCDAVMPGRSLTIGPWRIDVLPASHDRMLLMGVPFNGQPRGTQAPVRAADWVCGQPLSYLISTNGCKIFVDSGGTTAVLPPSRIGPVDLAILGMALPDSRARFASTMQRLRPRYVLPSHQDNFFLPLSRGFQFAPLTNFGFVRAEHHRDHPAGRLILLNYFAPWTLPRR